jgi:hypothetical protein
MSYQFAEYVNNFSGTIACPAIAAGANLCPVLTTYKRGFPKI